MQEKDEAQKRALKKAGFKATPSRLAVLAFVAVSRHPLTADEIIKHFKGKMNKVTVYRMLKAFTVKGVIRQVDLRHNHAHFELADPDDHHHVVCMRCGKIENIEGCGLGEMHERILSSVREFAQIKQHSLEFYGICKRCVGKS